MEKASTKHTFLQLQVVHIPSLENIILICSQVASYYVPGHLYCPQNKVYAH